jgi:hypothetical protein
VTYGWGVTVFAWVIIGLSFTDAMSQHICKGAEFGFRDRAALVIYWPYFASARIGMWVADPKASTEPLICARKDK